MTKSLALTSCTLFSEDFRHKLRDPKFRQKVAFQLGIDLSKTQKKPKTIFDDTLDEAAELLKALDLSTPEVDHELALVETNYVIRGILVTMLANYYIPVDNLASLTGETKDIVTKYTNRLSLNKDELTVMAVACMQRWAKTRHDANFTRQDVNELCQLLEITPEYMKHLEILIAYLATFGFIDMKNTLDITKFTTIVRKGFPISQTSINLLTFFEKTMEVSFIDIPGKLKLGVDMQVYVRNIATRMGVPVSGVTIHQLICDCWAASYVYWYRYGSKHPRTNFSSLEHIVEPIVNRKNEDSLFMIEDAPIDLPKLYDLFGLCPTAFCDLIIKTYKLVWVYFMCSYQSGMYEAPVSMQTPIEELDDHFFTCVNLYSNNQRLPTVELPTFNMKPISVA